MGEIEQEKDYLAGNTISTIYFGGGTPSLLETGEIAQILQAISGHFTIEQNAEITLEANPDDITAEKLEAWKKAGINRLSIGIQSFNEEELRWMNRAHNAAQAAGCIDLCREKGFHNFSIDLIYGSPLLTDEMWEQHVKKAISANIPHLSCYALTVEEKTPLHKSIHLLKTSNVDADRQARQFQLLMKWLRAAGYEHYEVSNFAKPGFRSRHNSSYWKGAKYLGLGPSAHSYNETERRWNIPNNPVYIKSIQDGNAERETETLTETQQLNEFIMISLRTMEGMDLAVLQNKWGVLERTRVEREMKSFINSGLAVVENNSVRLTDEGMLMADGIAAQLFAEEASNFGP
jgi:oxygen-independent coproporphyrinogen-3 oxidase